MKYIKIIDPKCIIQFGFHLGLYSKDDILEVIKNKDDYYILNGIQGTRTSVRIRDKDHYYTLYNKDIYRVVNRLLYDGVCTQQVFSEKDMLGDLDIDTETIILLTGEDFNPKLVSFKQEIIVL